MNNLLEELKKIDWIKNTLYLLLFTVFVLFFFMFIINPALKEFKSANIEYRKAIFLNDQAKRELEQKSAEKKEFLDKNGRLVAYFDKRFNLDELLKFLSNHFEDVKIKSISETNQSEYGQKIINIEAIMESPSSFNSMLEGINSFGALIKVDFPITFVAFNGKIKSEFVLRYYYLETKKGE